MFDLITLGPFGWPRPAIDAGLLAECLLFYGKVRVVSGPATLQGLVRACGLEELLELCDMGCLEIAYVENTPVISTVQTTVGPCHDMGFLTSPVWKFSRIARPIAEEEGGTSSRKVTRLFERLQKAVKRTQYDGEIIKGSQDDLKNRGYLESSVGRLLGQLVPEYTLPSPLIFAPQTIPKLGIRYETNINFDEANSYFHSRVSSADATLSPAHLLSVITSAEPDIIFASKDGSDFAVDPIKSAIVSSRVADILRKSYAGRENLETFQDVIIDQSRSVREAVNSGDRNFKEVIGLLSHAEKFKKWVQGAAEDRALRDEYCRSVSSTDWADKLPPKSIRFAVMNALAIAAGVAMTPVAGIATGLALNAADAFLLDRLLKGWKPSQFVESSLKPFIGK